MVWDQEIVFTHMQEQADELRADRDAATMRGDLAMADLLDKQARGFQQAADLIRDHWISRAAPPLALISPLFD
jgi:hypothetical protein